MTEFRTKGKGKNRKIYPVKRKAYGVPRELAYKDVEKLRAEGDRARLIKTNKRLDLYAPYESVLPPGDTEEKLPNKKFSSYEEIEEEFGMSRGDAQGWADVHPDMLEGDVKEDVEQFNSVVRSAKEKDKSQNPGSTTVLDIQKMRDGLSQAVKGKEWSGIKPEMYSQNGEVFTTLTNSSHTVMIYEKMEGTAPSDDSHTFKVPAVAYPDAESGNIAVDGDSRKDLIRMIAEARKTRKGSEPIVYFTTPEHSQETYIGVFYSETDMVGKPIKIWNRTSTHTNVQDVILGTYLAEAMRAVNKMDKSLGVKNGSLTLEYKSDFPLRISSGNGKVSTNALIAPRVSEQYDVSSMDKMIMANIKKS